MLTLDEVIGGLDDLFGVKAWEGDPGMSRFLPQAYEALDVDYRALFEPDFCQRFNGLMLRGGDRVREVFCAAFPSPDILEALLAQTRDDALLFTHHPIDMEVGGVGFLPLAPEHLEALRAKGVSLYACHAPMDVHDEIGTNAAIVAALGVEVERGFAPYGLGLAGRLGTLPSTSLDALVRQVRNVFGVERVDLGGAQPERVTRLAIVAGGGDDVELFQAAEAWGADAYLTGEWTTRATPPGEAERAWAAGNRAACQAYVEGSEMAFVAVSHAASEHLVMVAQMVDWFRRAGLPAVCLEPEDWWR
jgi:putative NIF3 family GTP cyclohydrolase 1 type 2